MLNLTLPENIKCLNLNIINIFLNCFSAINQLTT